ncbi:MAG: hypothetical protein AB7G23_10795 [Vicinamibacterales bacterium]
MAEAIMKSEEAQVWLALYNENCVHGRHHETQRSVMTAFVIASTAALANLALADKSVDVRDLPYTVALTLFGLFGAVLSAKHYERFKDHMRRASLIRKELDSGVLNGRAQVLREEAHKIAKAEFPRLYEWRLNWGWISLHLVVAAVGFVLCFIEVFRPFAWST